MFSANAPGRISQYPRHSLVPLRQISPWSLWTNKVGSDICSKELPLGNPSKGCIGKMLYGKVGIRVSLHNWRCSLEIQTSRTGREEVMECGNIIYQRPAEIFNLGDERRGAAQWLWRGGGCATIATCRAARSSFRNLLLTLNELLVG